MPSLTRHSYSEKESMYTTVGILGNPSFMVIIFKVVPIAYVISTPYTILYNSEASALRVTRLLLVELYVMILLVSVKVFSSIGLSFSLLIITIYPIWELKSLLLANDPSTNTKILAVVRSRLIYYKPRSWLSSCHLRRLFNLAISSESGRCYYAATDRSKNALGWQTVAT